MPSPTPNKPTPEELKAKEDEAIKAAEELEDKQSIPEDKEEDEKKEVAPEGDQLSEEEVQDDETLSEEKEEEAEPSKEVYKKKFSASSRENQRINAKNRVINKALADAEDVPEPTEEELEKEFTDWDVMSDTEKIFAKETVVSRKWRKVIADAKDQATKIEKWNDSVEEFITDPKTLLDNPELEGKADEFREFATIEENNSVPYKLLVSAFLHDRSTKKVSNKGSMFPKGSGGPNEKPQPKDGTITLEEARALRDTNYDKWKEMLMAGKIKSDL